MAQLIVSCVVDKLADLLIQEASSFDSLFEDVGDKIDNVKVHLSRMQTNLKVAESKKSENARTNKPDDVTNDTLVQEVLKIAYETEDAVDKFIVEINRTWGNHVSLITRCIRNLPAELSAFRKLAKSVVGIQAMMHRLYQDKETYPINISEEGHHAPRRRLIIPELIDDSEVIGFEDEKRNVVNALVHCSSQSLSLQTFSIVGPAGSGKTTLAGIVYESMEVKEHFPIRVWLSLAGMIDMEPREILKKLYEITKEKGYKIWGEQDMEFLSSYGNNSLSKKRYLVVIDDVWREDFYAEVMMGLPDHGNGSRVLITSLFTDIAQLGDPRSIQHEIRFLNEDESFDLLLMTVFNRTAVDIPLDLLSPARQLSKRCGGVPLALVLFGQRLSKMSYTYAHWSRVLQTFDWNSASYEGNPLHQLITSYDDLPDFLKSCFRYLAIFPHNYKIPSKYLYKLWIAEGLVVPKGTVALEEIAEDYLENLVQRSMVQVDKKYSDGAIKSCHVHILFHELSIILARESNFLVICNTQGIIGDLSAARCVAIHNHFEINGVEKKDMPSVRSFLNFGKDVPFQIRFMLVRVLELRGAKNLKSLPKGLQNMIHLRYLGVRSTNVNRIPKRIGRLQNLQTLDVRDTNVTYIPVSLWKIKTLRHVYGSKPRNSFLIPDGPPP